MGQRIELPSFDLNAKLLDSLDIDERPPPIVKLAVVQHHAHLLVAFFYGQPIRVYSYKRNETVGHIGEAN